MSTLLIILHVLSAIIIIVAVLMQKGKGADMGFTGGSESVLGSGGANFFSRLTTGSAVVFMATGLLLAIVQSQTGGSSVVDGLESPVPVEQSAPASNSQSGAE